MNKFIISESEKQRILEMHQNATSRQYLMEIHSSETINVTIPWTKNAEGKEIYAKSQFNNSEYYPTFSYLEGDPDVVKQIDKDPSKNPYSIKRVGLPGTQTEAIPIGPQKFVKGSDGNYYLTGKLQIPQDIKTTWGVVANTIIIFTDGQSVSGGVVYKKGIEYKKPIQKESDLRRIVKNVINERRYLMEGMDPRIDTLLNNIVTQINSKITAINTSSKTKIPNVSFKEVPDGDTSVSYDFYMGQSNIGRLPYKYLLNNWSSFESKLYNLFKYSTNTSLSLVLKANGLGNNMLEFSNAATGVVYEILQGFQWDGKPTQ
jgi:hypothetical protein